MIQEMTAEQLAAKIDDQEPCYIIDVREDHEWRSGYIPQAIHVPLNVVAERITSVVPDKNAEVIVYCLLGGRSAMAADILKSLGYQNLYSLTGGIQAWCENGEKLSQ